MQTEEDMQTVDIAGALSSVTQRGHAGLAGPGRAVPGELAVGDEVPRGGSAAGSGGAGTPAGDPGDVSAALAGAPSSRGTHGDGLHAVVSPQSGKAVHDAVTIPAALCLRLLGQAAQIHRAGLKSYGLLTAEPGAAGYPLTATGVVFLDSRKNRRNDPDHRAAFRAQGEYFRQFDDAGFVADPAELLAACRAIEEAGAQIVAPFHSHRRQPANFSLIDYRLHNPAFAWHLIISLRDPRRPVLQPFGVQKDWSDFGISDQDACQGSELAYPGPEVAPLNLIAHGAHPAIYQLASTLGLAGRPKTRPAAATGRARPHTVPAAPAR